jgi:aspartyl-tRNA(Asn)/glutamyl-tRNA(Gln) amidotransferase subunit A
LPERIYFPLQRPVTTSRGWKVALSLTLGDYDLDDDVRRNTIAVAETLREAGVVVEEVELPWRRQDILQAAMIHYGTIFGAWIKEVVTAFPADVTRYAVAFADRSSEAASEPGAYLRGLQIEGRIYEALGDLFTRYDFLLCPTLALPALEAGKDYVDEPLVIGGKEQEGVLSHLMTIPFNICSRCPVMSVPSGFSRDGVPTGVQIVGRPYQDRQVVHLAYVLEERRPWLDSPEHRPPLTSS